MNNQITKFSIIILSAIFLLSSPALAGGKGKGKTKSTPPGWEQGEKKGWKGEDAPPGLTEEKLEKKQKAGMQKQSKKTKQEAEREKEKVEQEAEMQKEKRKREAEMKKEKEQMKSRSMKEKG